MSELIPLIMRFTLVGSLPGHLFAFWDPTWQPHFPGDQRCCALYFASNYLLILSDSVHWKLQKNINECLYNILQNLGRTISKKKLVPPSTKAICLGVMINTEQSTISIPSEKLTELQNTVQEWITKTTCSKRQLQFILGYFLYVHKCVRSGRLFLNKMF